MQLNKKVKEAAKKAEQADQKYAQSVDACKLIQDKHYNEEMPRILAVRGESLSHRAPRSRFPSPNSSACVAGRRRAQEFESTEKARIECMKEALINYVKQQETVAPEVVSACGRMMKGAEAISAESDLKQYVNEKRTNNPKPPRAEYEPYFSAADASAVRCCSLIVLALSLSLASYRFSLALGPCSSYWTECSEHVGFWRRG